MHTHTHNCTASQNTFQPPMRNWGYRKPNLQWKINHWHIAGVCLAYYTHATTLELLEIFLDPAGWFIKWLSLSMCVHLSVGPVLERSTWRVKASIWAPGGCGRTTWLWPAWHWSSSPSPTSNCTSWRSSLKTRGKGAIPTVQQFAELIVQLTWLFLRRNFFVLLLLPKSITWMPSLYIKYLLLIYSAKMSSMAHSSLPQRKRKSVQLFISSRDWISPSAYSSYGLVKHYI